MLSAQSQNVSVLLRALAENHQVEVLERPQITTLDNQPANVQVGQRVPTITSVTTNALTGQANSVTFQNVGVILGVTPRISPDGLVVMQIDAEKSALEPEATGIPIFSSPTGQVIRSPIIDTTVAQTTVSAMDGQTIVLGGLITKTKNDSHRGVPWLGDLPLVGNFFRFDSASNDRTELLIIMTPHMIRTAADIEALKREEAAQMNWCLCDVTKIFGEAGLRRAKRRLGRRRGQGVLSRRDRPLAGAARPAGRAGTRAHSGGQSGNRACTLGSAGSNAGSFGSARSDPAAAAARRPAGSTHALAHKRRRALAGRPGLRLAIRTAGAGGRRRPILRSSRRR